MRLIDSHCHLHDDEFFTDQQRQEVYERAIQSDIGMICVGTDEKSSKSAVDFASSHELAWAAVGVHPHDAKFGCKDIKTLLDTKNLKIIAIGEIGLDYFYDNSPRDLQKQVFEEQLQLAVDYDLPISFHVRNGFDDFWPIINNFPSVRGVLHSFTDSRANAERALERGFYIGINGIATFTKDEEQIELYRSLPVENILLETDAPFLTPKPFRGKMNEVGYVELVAEWCANVRDISLEEVSKITTQNTLELFNI